MSNKPRKRPTTQNPAVRTAIKEARDLKKRLSDTQVDNHRLRKAIDAILEHHQMIRTEIDTVRAQAFSMRETLLQNRLVLAAVMLEVGRDEIFLPGETIQLVADGEFVSGIELQPTKDDGSLDMTVRIVYVSTPTEVVLEEVDDEGIVLEMPSED